ncbi:uncharacterized protein LOC133186233 [Saccostrea echinata]|uniref:uncharacterized protein LOC133186233 n=1 Tax=Saccostrea echinata TaxID=191078 RepID=UPI002A808A64|nr:uncharacterized protein LOC133186233 [Saccostrea echinata]
MDPRLSAQDILRCKLCDTPIPLMYCAFCQVSLCKPCVGEHLSDLSTEHKVVPFKQRGFTPILTKCRDHKLKHCELHCENCHIPVCLLCISSDKHQGHRISNTLQNFAFKKETLQKDLTLLVEVISPKYENLASEIKMQKGIVEEKYNDLTLSVVKHGEDWHRHVDIAVSKRKSEIEENKTKHLSALSKHEVETNQMWSYVKKSITEIKTILNSDDISLVSEYKRESEALKKVPPNLKIMGPQFASGEIDDEKLLQLFGNFSPITIAFEDEEDLTLTTAEGTSLILDVTKEKPTSPQSLKPLICGLDSGEITDTINTGYQNLRSVSCLNDEEIWTCGTDNIISLFNFQSPLLKKVKTISGGEPWDITVTKNGELIYTDDDAGTVNVVKDKGAKELIKMRGWKPYNVCCTMNGDLLVIALSKDWKRTKIIRYSGTTEKQTVELDDSRKPLFKVGKFYRYILENRNKDICVADCGAGSVFVVNFAGKVRFRYSCHSSITKKEAFTPRGITTDSQK